MPLTFAGSELVALCLESVFYGIYLLMFLEHLEVIFRKQRRRAMGASLRLPVVMATSAIFALVTTHEVIDAIRLYSAYHGGQTNAASGADRYYSDITSMLSIMKMSVYLVETAVSDLFLLYRCYIVWGANSAVLALPVVLYVADIATGIMAVYTLSSDGMSSIFNWKQKLISNSFFFCTLTLNALCSGLLAFRIWKTHKQSHDARMGANLQGVFIIVIESGVMYLIALACEVGTFTAGSYFFNVFLDVISPVIGIVFLFIIVRIGRHNPLHEEGPRPPRSILYPGPSGVACASSSASVVFKLTTATTPITRMNPDGSEPMFENDAMRDEE